MGATNIIVRARGKNINEAFKNAQGEAEREYGQDIYNGAINNCSFIRDVTHKLGEFPEDDHFHDWIWNNTNKRDIMGYCTSPPVNNKNKTKTVVERIPQKGTRKWVTIYEAYDSWDNGDKVYASADNLTEAIAKTRKYVETNPHKSLEIRIVKKLDVGNQKCAKVKYKKSKEEREGSYTFVGYAPC